MWKWIKRHPVVTAIFGYLAVMGIIAGFAVHWLFYDMQRLPTEERLAESRSPDGRYTVTLYRNNGGATVPFTLSGELTAGGKRKIIYWAKGEEAGMEWLDPETVRINGVTLTVSQDTYDYRHP